MHHNHKTGEFIAWCCRSCNADIEHADKRITGELKTADPNYHQKWVEANREHIRAYGRARYAARADVREAAKARGARLRKAKHQA